MAGDWRDAIERLHATNNFPEFTGRLCPAPCETACVLGINQDPVTIKNVEVSIIDKAWAWGWSGPSPPEVAGKTVAVVGSAARPGWRPPSSSPGRAHRRGHERADRIGGLLRYGIPEFKMEKKHLSTSAWTQMRRGHPSSGPGRRRGEQLTGDRLRDRYDAVVLAVGATDARDLAVTGREPGGIHQAMEFLPQANRAALGDTVKARSPPPASTW